MNGKTRSLACTAFLLTVCSLGTTVAAEEFSAARGDRTGGYLAQSRSEVLATCSRSETRRPLPAAVSIIVSSEFARGGS